MSSLCLWFVPTDWTFLQPHGAILYITPTHTHIEFWSETLVSLKVRLKQTLSVSNSGCFLRPGPPPPHCQPPSAWLPPTHGGTTHMWPAQKSCLCSGKYSPGYYAPSSCQGDSVKGGGGGGGSRSSKHSQHLWEAGGVQTEAAAFSLTWHGPLPQTWAIRVKSAFLCQGKSHFECSWKQQESLPSSNPLISYLYGADEEEGWAEESSGTDDRVDFFLWWGSFWVSASISAGTFETIDLLWDKQRLGGTYVTQAIAAAVNSLWEIHDSVIEDVMGQSWWKVMKTRGCLFSQRHKNKLQTTLFVRIN